MTNQMPGNRLRAGLLRIEDVRQQPLWQQALASLGESPEQPLDDLLRHRVIRRLVGIFIRNAIEATAAALTENHVHSVAALRGLSLRVPVGERVVVRRNSTERTIEGDLLDIANGQAGTVTAIADSQITVRLDAGDEVTLTDRYLRRGGALTHAYALTTHRAQGGTWDLAIAVGTDGLYRETPAKVRRRRDRQVLQDQPLLCSISHLWPPVFLTDHLKDSTDICPKR